MSPENQTNDPKESAEYLSEQIITYLGNKRMLLDSIGVAVEEVKKNLGQSRITTFDVFSGSGIVSRFMKKHSSMLYANDLESYSRVINECYLSNIENVDLEQLRHFEHLLKYRIKRNWREGFITELYAPQDDNAIKPEERVFFTHRNAMYIDTARQEIGRLTKAVRTYFLASLIYGASVHVNTSGVFKGFYKNKEGIGQFGGDAKNNLIRIMGDITVQMPVFSRFSCPYEILQMDALQAAQCVEEVDLAYVDPPYNEHPYGSNYFMLNMILSYERPTVISKVSGIPEVWNRSDFNRRSVARETLFKLLETIKAKYLLISYNSEGFVSYDDFVDTLAKMGDLQVYSRQYTAFRASRNLHARDRYVKEYLFLLKR